MPSNEVALFCLQSCSVLFTASKAKHDHMLGLLAFCGRHATSYHTSHELRLQADRKVNIDSSDYLRMIRFVVMDTNLVPFLKLVLHMKF